MHACLCMSVYAWVFVCFVSFFTHLIMITLNLKKTSQILRVGRWGGKLSPGGGGRRQSTPSFHPEINTMFGPNNEYCFIASVIKLRVWRQQAVSRSQNYFTSCHSHYLFCVDFVSCPSIITQTIKKHSFSIILAGLFFMTVQSVMLLLVMMSTFHLLVEII